MAMTGDGGSSLRRGLSALELLAHADGRDDAGLGVVDVARLLGVDKSQASRTLRALADHGLAERDPASRAYRLGPRVFAPAALRALFDGVELVPRAPSTVGSLEALIERVQEAAARGYAVVDQELEAGLAAVAAPVRRFD